MHQLLDDPTFLVTRTKLIFKPNKWWISRIVALITAGIGLAILIYLLFDIYWFTPYQIDLILGSVIPLGGGMVVVLLYLARTSRLHQPPISTYIPLQPRDSRPPLPAVRSPPRHPVIKKDRSPFKRGGFQKKHLRTRYHHRSRESETTE